MVDDWDFNKNTFEPYLTDFVTIFLHDLLPNVSLTETRLYVLNTLTDIVIQTKPLVNKQLLIQILDVIPKFWELASTDPTESILANVLLRLLRYLALALGKYSFATWDISLTIIEVACNPSSSHFSLLFEDGLELWHALLQNYDPKENTLDERFINMSPYLQYSVENQTELLPVSLEILKSYALILPPKEFHSIPPFNSILHQISNYLLKLRDDSFSIIVEIWDLLALADGIENDASILFHFSNNLVFKSIFDAIFLEEQLSTYQMGYLFQLLARISFNDPKNILILLSDYQKGIDGAVVNSHVAAAERKLITCETPFNDVLRLFFDIWCKCYDSIYDPKLKKIHLLGISSLLKTGAPQLLMEFKIIVSFWITSMEEINETSQGDCEKYHLSDSELNEESTCEHIRQHELIKNNDPAHNVGLKTFISDLIDLLQRQMQNPTFDELISTLDPALIENLSLFMSIKPN